MNTSETTIMTARAGSIVRTGYGCPRCYRVLGPSGRDLFDDGPVDMGTAFRLLAHWSDATEPDQTGQVTRPVR